MSRKWNTNWLLFFTIALFISALAVFVTTFKDQFGLKKCVYGGMEYTIGQAIPDQPKCFCNEKGEVICEEMVAETNLESTEFVNDDLEFSYGFLNFVDLKIPFESMRFDEVSTVDKGLKVVVERLSMCNVREELPPQIGYYMFDGTELHLTTTTNLLAGNYNKECIVSNIFLIHGLSEVSKVSYISEDNRVIEAKICVFEGRVFNEGDAYVVDDSGEVVICN
jgi:hypothetical protein